MSPTRPGATAAAGRALAVAIKELRMISRGRLFFLAFVQPLIFCLIWGLCASGDIGGATVGTVDLANTGGSRELVRALGAFDQFGVERLGAPRDLADRLARGDADLGLVVQPGFGRRGAAAPDVQVVGDGTQAIIAERGTGYATAIVDASMSRRPPRRTDADGAAFRSLHNPGLIARPVALLNAIAYNLMWFMVYPAGSLIAERASGNAGMLRAAPLRAAELWAGLILPNGLIALWGALLQLAAAVGLADVGLHRPGLAAATLVLFCALHMNLGCFLGAIVRRPEHRTLVSLAYIFTSVALGGFLIPTAFLPAEVRGIASAFPLTHVLALVRSTLLRGDPGGEVLGGLAVLGGMTIATAAAALIALRRYLDEEGAS